MSGGTGSGPLQPTWHGFIQNSMDGLVLFEACLSGKLHHVPRRPHDRERSSLIKSGCVFVYEENASGIKRWTDGVAWSPSRILGNFLIYRELEKPFPPGEKKRAMKRKRSSQEPEGRRDSEENEAAEYNRLPPTPPSPANPQESKPSAPGAQDSDKDVERQLIGSLVDSYGFRPNGLVKKTMSITLNGVSHHLVSYYTVDDVKKHKLHRPVSDTRLGGITVRPELYMKQNFRAPVEEAEQYAIDPMTGHVYPQMSFPSQVPAGGYVVRPGYTQHPNYQGYAPPITTAPLYAGVPATTQTAGSWPHPYSAGSTQPSFDYYNRHPSSTPQASSTTYPPMQHYSSSPMRTPAQSYGQPSMAASSTPSQTPASSHYQPAQATATSHYQPAQPGTAPQYQPSQAASTSQYQPTQAATASQYQPGSYAVQSNTQQSVSPQQQNLRSPPLGPPPQSLNSYSSRPTNLPNVTGYRQYPSQSAGTQGEMPSIGLASTYGSNHAQPSSTHYGGPSYSTSGISAPQAYRHGNEPGTGVQTGQY